MGSGSAVMVHDAAGRDSLPRHAPGVVAPAGPRALSSPRYVVSENAAHQQRDVVAPGHVGDVQVQAQPLEEAAPPEPELEPVVAGGQRSLEQVVNPAVVVGQGLGHAHRPPVVGEAEEGHPDAGRGRCRARYRGRGSRWSGSAVSRPAPRYPPRMGTLQIVVGDLHLSARWEPVAPQTVEAIRRMLPIESKLIHCRWTGEFDMPSVGRLPLQMQASRSLPIPADTWRDYRATALRLVRWPAQCRCRNLWRAV